MFLMSPESMRMPVACLQGIIKATVHLGAVYVASEVQFSFKLFNIGFSALTATALPCECVEINLVGG